jgi:hypothetical protein
MGLALVYLTELLFSVKFNADSILKYVLNMLLLSYDRAILVLRLDNFLKVSWMAPRNLYCCRSLSNVGEDAHSKRVFFDLLYVDFEEALVKLEAILVLIRSVTWRYRLTHLFLSEIMLHHLL